MATKNEEPVCAECAERELRKLGGSCPEMDLLEQKVVQLEGMVAALVERLRVTTLAMKYEHLDADDRARAERAAHRIGENITKLQGAISEAVLPTHLGGAATPAAPAK